MRWRGWLRAQPVLQGVLPIERSRVPIDMLAGVATLAALGIPEVLGYAKIAGMPLVTGLYTMLLPMAVFAVLGSFRHLVVAADSATAAILAAALAGMAVAGSGAVRPAGWTGGPLAGVMLALVARLARLAFLANFLSRTVLVGFLAGVGIQVAAGQLPDMLGVTAAGKQTLPRLLTTVRALPHVHPADVAISIGVIVIVVAARRITRRIPGPLIAVIIAIIVSWAVGLASHGVAVVGPVPRGLPSLGAPARLARRHRAARRRGVDVRGHPGAERGHLPGLRREVRGAVQRSRRSGRPGCRQHRRRVLRHVRGQRQPDQGADGRHRRRPQPAGPAHRLRRGSGRPRAAHRAAGVPAGRRPGGGGLPHRGSAHRRQGEAAIRTCRNKDDRGLLTAAAVVALGVEYGITLAVVASIVNHLRHSYSPLNSVLVKSPAGHWHAAPVEPGARTEEGLVVYRFGTSLYYANAAKLVEDVATLVGHGSPLRWMVVDCAAIGDVDYTASTVLAKLVEHVHQRRVHLVFSSVLGPVRQQLDRYGICKALGPDAFYDTPGEALEAFHAADPDRSGGTAGRQVKALMPLQSSSGGPAWSPARTATRRVLPRTVRTATLSHPCHPPRPSQRGTLTSGVSGQPSSLDTISPSYIWF